MRGCTPYLWLIVMSWASILLPWDSQVESLDSELILLALRIFRFSIRCYYASVGCSVSSVVTLVPCLRCGFHGLRPFSVSYVSTETTHWRFSGEARLQACNGYRHCWWRCSWAVFSEGSWWHQGTKIPMVEIWLVAAGSWQVVPEPWLVSVFLFPPFFRYFPSQVSSLQLFPAWAPGKIEI